MSIEAKATSKCSTSYVPQVGIPVPILCRRNARKIHESLIIADEVHMDTPIFGDFDDFGELVVL